jgi:hypothetical protein
MSDAQKTQEVTKSFLEESDYTLAEKSYDLPREQLDVVLNTIAK